MRLRFKLMVNHNCGAGNYVKEKESDDIEELKAEGANLDKKQLRWVIEDTQKDDKIVFYCAIHRAICNQAVRT